MAIADCLVLGAVASVIVPARIPAQEREDLVRALGFEDGGNSGLLPLADEVVLLQP
jgi:hypothetical protein